MMVSSNYVRALERYLEWESVTTPASGSFQESKKPAPQIAVAEGGMSASEALCLWESRGEPCCVCPKESQLLNRYLHGKSQRYWWNKELGWWNKHAVYIAEEFLSFLGPLPFIEMFGRAPITRLVRYYYDNGYALWEFRLDGLMLRKVEEWGMSYYERDDRDSALRNAWRVLMVKWFSPAIYRIRRRLCS